MILSDNDRNLAIKDVLSGKYDNLFYTPEEFPTKPGFFPIAKWIKFDIQNSSQEEEWLLEFAFPLIYQLHMYEVTEKGYKKLVTSGADFPYEMREMDHRNFAFTINVKPNETKSFYTVLHGGADLHPAIKLWSKDAFVEHIQIEHIVLGLFYGMLIVMVAYNLFLYFSLKIRAYLYYVILMFCTMIAQLALNGLGYKFLWPNFPEWNVMAVPFWVGISCVFVILFTKSFLDTAKYVPRFRYLSYALILLNIIMVAFLFIEHYIALNLMFLSTFATFTAVITVTIVSLIKGVREARFLVLGWSVFLIGVFVTILERATVLPYNNFTEYAGQGGFAFQVVLLSVALGDKINIIRYEKSKAERKARESQELALKSLKKADELKDEFLAITSHELRTPLYGMIGIAESLREGAAGRVREEITRQLDMIIISGRRLSHLVNDILDFSQLKHEAIAIEIRKVNLYSLVDIVFTVCHPLLKDKDVQLVNHIPENVFVKADPDRLQQILYNLVGNALEFTDEGLVTVSTEKNDEKIDIRVTDTGKGIDMSKQGEIFEPFKQIASSKFRQIGGTGIGLNVTKQLVELHGSELSVESELGKGSIFSFSLMAASEAEEYLEQEVIEEVSSMIEPVLEQSPSITSPKVVTQSKGLKVLIVDDEPINLQVLMNQLTLEGIDVVKATCGKDVFELVEQHTFDVLILDIMMPNMSGFEVCERLRKTYTLIELPILMLTAKNQVRDKITAFEVGANDYLTKPCEREELLSRVKILAQMRRLNDELQHLNMTLEDIVKERTDALQKANISLSNTNHALTEVVESRRNLLANIAHELGTPVTLIHSYIQSLQEGLVSRDDQFYRQLVDDKMNVLSRIIDDLSDLSKLEAGSVSLNVQEKDLFTWLRSSRKKIKMDVQTFNRTIKVKELSFSANIYIYAILIKKEWIKCLLIFFQMRSKTLRKVMGKLPFK